VKLRRNNHYLPECYQRGFANERGQVWVKFSSKPAPTLRNPRTVGKQRNFYIRKRHGKDDDQIESFFGKGVETPFALLSQRIRSERENLSSISGTEFGILLRFVASQAVRTLAHKR
jgi:Protein of unknown function (DUF4238)